MMKASRMFLRCWLPWWAIVLLTAWACAPDPDANSKSAEPGGEESAGDPAIPEDPAILRRPFTADQIRDKWVVGLTLKIRFGSPQAESIQRWTVISADAEGADIEYANLDGEGQVMGEVRVERSTWVELRDHATFPAVGSSREQVTRETALGELIGWLYTVSNSENGTVSEFFFVEEFPGAPVTMRVLDGEDVVSEMEQLERRRP